MHSVKLCYISGGKTEMRYENFDFYRKHSLRDIPISKHFEKILKIPRTRRIFFACVFMNAINIPLTR